ncbi:MAG: efflux RND transporter permease subunit [Pseudomonadales bacterium]|nr:efflux RND transporter permease subunit [Pseudomonadales bacterium]
MRNRVSGYATALLRHQWLTCLLTIAIVVISSYGARFLTFTTDYQAFFSDENPQLQAYENLKSVYNQSDNVLIVLAPKNGDVFTPATLALVQELTELSWQVPYSLRVDSLANYQHTEAIDDELNVSDLYEEPNQLSELALKRIKSIATNEATLVGHIISPSGHVTGIDININLPGKSLTESGEVAAHVRQMVADIQVKYPDVDIYLTGLLMLNNAFSDAARNDMKKLMPLMYLLVLVALAVLMKTFKGVALTLLVILMSVSSVIGFSGWLGWQMSPPTVSSPTIILTIAVANCVHILVSYLASARRGKSRRDAMIESIEINLYPILITGFTTIIGFLTLNFSEVPPYQDLGNLVAMGVAAAMVLSLTFLPAAMVLLPGTPKPRQKHNNPHMLMLANFIIRYKLPLVTCIGITTIVLISALPLNKLDDKFVENFKEDMPFRIASQFTTENLTGVYTIEYSITHPEAGGVAEPGYLQRLERFTDWLKSQPEVLHVASVLNVVKRLNMNMHGDQPDWYRVPESRELAAQYLLLYEMSLPFGLDLTNQINMDKSASRVVVTFIDLSTEQMLNIEKRIENWWQTNETSIAPVGSSATLMFSHISQRNIKSLLFGAIVALIFISFILIAALKSWRIGLISLVPNLVPAAMAFGIWGIFVGKVGMGLSVVVGMTIGIIVDDTVHFLAKYLRAKREHNMSTEDAIRYAFSTVGIALWITSLVLVIGFMVLSFSEYNRNAEMGLMTAITIALALVVDFLLLPAILLLLDDKKAKQEDLAPLNSPIPITQQ